MRRGGPSRIVSHRCVLSVATVPIAVALVGVLPVSSAHASHVDLRPVATREIGGNEPGRIPGTTLNFWFDDFGAAVAALGDLDGDGVPDVTVGAPMSDELGPPGAGAVDILFLKRDGTARAQRQIDGSGGTGNLSGTIADGDLFGAAVAAIGDLDGDGNTEVAVGAPGDDTGANDAGAVWILFLDAAGNVKSERKIASGLAGFSESLDAGSAFGSAVTAFAQPQAGGAALAVGAPGVDSTMTGMVWLLGLDAAATVISTTRIDAAAVDVDPAPAPGDAFGAALAVPGDVDGDGHEDLAIGAPRTPPRFPQSSVLTPEGALWLLLLGDGASIARSVRIGESYGGFAGELADDARFGAAVASVGDRDGNGVPDLAVTAPMQSVAWVLLLGTDAVVSSQRMLDSTTIPGLNRFRAFGTAIASAGDVDDNGVADLVIGGNLAFDGFPSTTTTTFFCPTTTSTSTTSSTLSELGLAAAMTLDLGEAPRCETGSHRHDRLRARDRGAAAEGEAPSKRRTPAHTSSATTVANGPRRSSLDNGTDKCGRPKVRRCGDEVVHVVFLDLEADPADCGNGVVDVGEACDDGNTDGLDCCGADCLVAPSGNECRFDENPCAVYRCDGNGFCVAEKSPEKTPCDDFFACVDSGQCIDGFCRADGVAPGLCRVDDVCRACGHPITSAGDAIAVTDALAVLRAAVGLETCMPCLCDVTGNDRVSVTDALVVLRHAVGAGGSELLCPHR